MLDFFAGRDELRLLRSFFRRSSLNAQCSILSMLPASATINLAIPRNLLLWELLEKWGA
jgi:hypothetical protein